MFVGDLDILHWRSADTLSALLADGPILAGGARSMAAFAHAATGDEQSKDDADAFAVRKRMDVWAIIHPSILHAPNRIARKM